MLPFVLLALAEAPMHGYVLAARMADLSFRRAAEDPSVVYRVLRQLAADDMVTDEWVLGDDAPPRRTYRLTPSGEAYLHERAADLRRQARRIEVFLDRYRQLFPHETAADSTSRRTREPRTPDGRKASG
ncbi:PadR family transcriptional regulator [Nonomuraea sp. NPDC050022]|uniref:PadR family transcriptional regulator n=1 Tax=unclassified Nonomuraea TaxID=2593643 RepID=UPI0033F6FC2D